MQVIYDLNAKSTNKSTRSIKLQNKVRDFYA